MTRRVAVTGMGLVCSLGSDVGSSVAAAREGHPGISAIRRFDTSAFQCRIAAQVADDAITPSSHHDRFSLLALRAADEAMRRAGLELPLAGPYRVGTLMGTGLGGSETLDAGYQRLYGGGSARMQPMTIPRAMYNAATSAVSAAYGARGPSSTMVAACASSAHAIGQAYHWIRGGFADVVIAGGSDTPIAPGIVRGWEALRVLAHRNEDPATACRPFNRDRDGIVLAEGAAVMILESFEHAKARGATIEGEIAGFGMTSDAGHLTDPSIEGAAAAMRAALADGGIDPSEIEYVNAHGTATRANDSVEAAAIRSAIGPHAAVSSTKSLHGHAMGASGAIEMVLSLACLNDGFIPPTANLTDIDPECDLDHVSRVPRVVEVATMMSNSFGFGGMNGVVIVRTARGTRR